MAVFRLLHLVHWEEKKDSNSDKETYVECNNLTLINFVLVWKGPTHEAELTTVLLVIQVYTLTKLFSSYKCRSYSDQSMGQTTEELWFDSQQGHSNKPWRPSSFLLSEYQGFFPQQKGNCGMKLTCYLLQVEQLRLSAAVTSLSHANIVSTGT